MIFSGLNSRTIFSLIRVMFSEVTIFEFHSGPHGHSPLPIKKLSNDSWSILLRGSVIEVVVYFGVANRRGFLEAGSGFLDTPDNLCYKQGVPKRKLQKSIIQSFLERHKVDDSSLLFWSANMVDYCRGRIVDFDEQHVLLRDYDEETERPYELVLRLDKIVAIYPSLEQKEEDERFRRIMKSYLKEND